MSQTTSSSRLLQVSMFAHVFDNVPVPQSMSYPEDLLDESAETDGTPKSEQTADGTRIPLWSPVSYRPGTTRGATNVTEVCALVLDVDGEAEITTAFTVWAAYDFVLHTTRSHSDTHPSYRIVLPYTRPITLGEHEATWSWASTQMGKTVDENCKDASRMYYVPSHSPGISPEQIHHPGALLEPRPASPGFKHPTERALGTLEAFAHVETTDWGREQVLAVLQRLDNSPEGERHPAMRSESQTLGGLVAGGNVSVADALMVCQEYATAWKGTDQMATAVSGLRLGLPRPLLPGGGDAIFRAMGIQPRPVVRTSKDAEKDYNHACKHGTPDEQERFKAEALELHEQEMQARIPQFAPPAGPPAVSEPFAARFHAEEELVLNDLENAKLLVDVHGLDIRHCERALGKGWLLWDESRWVPDTSQRILHLATGIGEEWRRIAAGASVRPRVTLTGQPKPSNQAQLHLWASHCENHKELKAAVALASTRPEVAVQLDRLDLDPGVLAMPGASYDLLTGDAYEPRREDYCTRLGGVLEGDGTCPTWTAFLDRCMGGNQEMISFLQRSVGYSMTGETSEQVWWQMHGKGANGKSTFVGAIMHVLGTYGSTVNISAFTERRHDPGIPNDIAALAGVRFVAVNEPNKTEALDTAKLKKITGGDDKMQARFLNKEFFEFLPQCKIWMLTNYQLVVKDDDDGFWRRVLLVPWQVQIPDAERDRHLGAKLRAESRGIFEWCLEGLRAWRRIGLSTPASVLNATTKYREDMDILGSFLQDCCKVDPQQTADNGTLYTTYQTWAQENGIKGVWSHNALSRALKDRGFTQRPPSNGKRLWAGFSLLKHPTRTSFVQSTTEVN